jgi:hypothetical protein
LEHLFFLLNFDTVKISFRLLQNTSISKHFKLHSIKWFTLFLLPNSMCKKFQLNFYQFSTFNFLYRKLYKKIIIILFCTKHNVMLKNTYYFLCQNHYIDWLYEQLKLNCSFDELKRLCFRWFLSGKWLFSRGEFSWEFSYLHAHGSQRRNISF